MLVRAGHENGGRCKFAGSASVEIRNFVIKLYHCRSDADVSPRRWRRPVQDGDVLDVLPEAGALVAGLRRRGQTLLNETQVSFFRDKGYLVLDTPVVDSRRVEELKERVLQVTRGEKGGADSVRNLVGGEIEASDRVVVQIVNIWQADPLFHELIYQDNITEMVSQLMGEDTIRLWHDQIQYKPAQVGAPTDWHQDHPYWPIIQPADLLSCWIALDDATVENGCMNVVPESHRWGAVPGGLRGDENFRPAFDDGAFIPAGASLDTVPCEVKSGCCMFHHCLTWHGSYYNRSEKPRRAIALHYMPGYTRYEPSGVSHLVEEHVEVQPGEVLKGSHFPTVRENGRRVSPSAVPQPA